MNSVKPVSNRRQITFAEWEKEGVGLFGTDRHNWRFVCPHCGQTQTAAEFKSAGIEDYQNKFFFSCIGRWVKDRGCDWTLGGLLQIHTTDVITDEGTKVPVFEFAKT